MVIQEDAILHSEDVSLKTECMLVGKTFQF